MTTPGTRTTATECELCGLPILGRPVRAEDVAGETHDFCCQGCKRVWAVAAEHGLDALMAGPVNARSRAADAAARKAAAAALAGARREVFRVEGMWCSSCSLILEEALLALPGVLDAEVSYAASLARVTYDPEVTTAEAAAARMNLLGYRASSAREEAGSDEGRDVQDLFLRFFVGAAIGMWVTWPTLFLLYPAFARGEYAGVLGVELFTAALSLVVLLYSGWPFLSGALRAARVGRATMDTLVVVGTWSAWFYSLWAALTGRAGTYFESAAMITVIVLLGRLIEALGRRSSMRALEGLSLEASAEAWRLPTLSSDLQQAVRVPVDSLAEDDTIVVRAGERILADGVVARGTSAVDQSRLTGEAAPAERGPDDQVFAGTINLTEPLVVRVTRVGGDTLAGRIADVVEDAAFAKSHSQRLADAIAGVFVPVVFAVASATLIMTAVGGAGIDAAVSRAVAVLVVACPCALGLATPLAVSSAMGAAGRRGMLVRGGPVLERAGQVAVVGFDKTGTLTQGRLIVTGVIPGDLAPAAAARMLDLAAALEAANPHPVAAAIASASASFVDPAAEAPGENRTIDRARLRPRAEDVRPRPGLGVEGTSDGVDVHVGSEALLKDAGIAIPTALLSEAREAAELGRTVVWVGAGNAVLGGLILADAARPEAAEVIRGLRHSRVRTVMISGDSRTTSAAIAAELGIDDVRAEVLPNEKEQVVRELRDEAGPVAFVGDGVNDAPALAASDLAIAVGGGSDVALAASDVVLFGADEASLHATHAGTEPGEDASTTPLAAVPYLLRLAASSRRIIHQNLGWAFSYNAVAVPLAIAGKLSPMAAAAAMALSSIAVVVNSLRVRLVR